LRGIAVGELRRDSTQGFCVAEKWLRFGQLVSLYGWKKDEAEGLYKSGLCVTRIVNGWAELRVDGGAGVLFDTTLRTDGYLKGEPNWRSVGHLFVNGWRIEDIGTLIASGLVQVRAEGSQKFVYLEKPLTKDEADELCKSARFIVESKLTAEKQDE
jgi:hypothetical protein